MHRTLLATSLGVALASLAASRDANAGGFYVTDRGVRAMGRAGAFVAGADDQHAIWYNPAGLAFAENGFLLDVTYLAYDQNYTRETGGQMLDPVHARPAPLVIPTLVVNHNFGLRDWMFAAGLFAPNAVITSYPETQTAPQRYSVVSLEGSILAIGGLWAAYKPRSDFSIGLGIQALVGSFASRMVLSGCPATITCQPEDPEWDASAQVQAGPIFAPSANLGVRWVPSRYVALGISGQLPFWVDAPATLQVRLPSASFYDGATVNGNRASVQFTMAPIIRAGVEVRPDPSTHVELAFVYEGWSIHDRIALTPVRDDAQPHGIQIANTRGVGIYDVGPTSIARNFQDTYSIRLGAERHQRIGEHTILSPRLGFAYETSATAPEYTSVLTFDTNHFLLTAGLGFTWNRLRIDVMFNHVFANSVAVAEADARIYQLAPFRASDQAPMHPINAGRYDLAVNSFGLGVRYSF